MRSATRQLPLSSIPSAATEHYLLRAAVAAVCTYEVMALATRRMPTVSRICRQHRWVEGVILAGLVVHFHLEEQMLTRWLVSPD